MRRAGEILCDVMDENLLSRVKTHIQLSSSWREIAAGHNADLASHSCVVELDKCILLIEAEHPAWIQILQMKRHLILKSFQDMFPALEITDITFKLSHVRDTVQAKAEAPPEELCEQAVEDDSLSIYERIKIKVKDEDFIESLKRLEKSYKKRAVLYGENIKNE